MVEGMGARYVYVVEGGRYGRQVCKAWWQKARKAKQVCGRGGSTHGMVAGISSPPQACRHGKAWN